MTTTAKPLPHPSDLQMGQALLCVIAYDEWNDMFSVSMHDASPAAGYHFTIPALMLPMLVHEYGEPSEFVGRTFLVEPGAKKADYARVYDALHHLLEGTNELNIRLGTEALNACPHPNQM